MNRFLSIQTRCENFSQLLITHLARQWEEAFFLFLFSLLSLQVFNFVYDAKTLTSFTNAAIIAFEALENFMVDYFVYATIPFIVLPLIVLLLSGKKSREIRTYLDIVGIYIVVRMFVQLIGLNLLLFDAVTQGIILITQLLLFLPYSLLVWGWIYWRIDEFASAKDRRCFRLDCERQKPRPLDYLVASFSSVFSASISAIKGRSARAKALIIIHGFFVYDLMGLTLSRAIALVHSK